jgi:phospholipid N-methyltransferase
MTSLTATYSPEDNKLRLYTVSRLDADTYARVRAAGFIWAPKQEFFVAPMWTPGREDLLLELCGEIEDEDSTLEERAAERAERFDEYSVNRKAEAEAARNAVAAIAENIPFGQPILVGHHSERRARKDAERIENGMRKAVNLWETSEYWRDRAAGALRHARHKERPDVRARRIKKLESEKRAHERTRDEATASLTAWSMDGLTIESAIALAAVGTLYLKRKEGDREDLDTRQTAYGALTNSYPNLYAPRTLDDIIEAAKQAYPQVIAHAERWIKHYVHRLTYERAMLEEQGGLVADKFDLQPGGQVLVRGEWAAVVRVTRRDGKAVSVTTNCRYVPVRSVEEIKDYRPPSVEQATAAASRAKLPPLCNYPGDGFHHMTKTEWNAIHKDYKGSRELGAGAVRPGGYRPDLKHADAVTNYGRHRVRSVVRQGALTAVFITDEKRKDPPAVEMTAPQPVAPLPAREPAERSQTVWQATPATDFDRMRDQLREGVKVVTALQLFPTPPELAARMADELMLFDGARVLEPSAGTGNIVRALRDTGRPMHIVAVEINQQLAAALGRAFPNGSHDLPQEVEVIAGDFMDSMAIGTFDAVAMNPPFSNAQDIAHIRKAMQLLNQGGRLVAICADGSRQNTELRPLIEAAGGTWQPLPAGSFRDSGTMVNTVLLTYSKP